MIAVLMCASGRKKEKRADIVVFGLITSFLSSLFLCVYVIQILSHSGASFEPSPSRLLLSLLVSLMREMRENGPKRDTLHRLTGEGTCILIKSFHLIKFLSRFVTDSLSLPVLKASYTSGTESCFHSFIPISPLIFSLPSKWVIQTHRLYHFLSKSS